MDTASDQPSNSHLLPLPRPHPHPVRTPRDLIEQIVYGGRDPATDPAWEPSGAATVEEYGALKYGAYTQDAQDAHGTIRG
ncbi:hypothetical protein J7E96_09095 [Streptomyces sp. ISL-96]|uniref:hypothetical protein n=1 Tax=Streptomyces sp. ISL-96 TaxID=2819191 RepID=UPI001BEC27E2|nr:hypothetical protein [Streptomyces sp. ISL-96]MBT2488677.1 hypothetical protein [Streptomyces sp. ISL-96]